MKKMLNKSFNSDLEEMLQYEAHCQEGVAAFFEKRKTEFKEE
jgi:2-(1,2-epoxy-1,2-dihydrophenyl)acetyl-CoA isomerase